MGSYHEDVNRPDIPGHELTGTVVENKNRAGPEVGARVGINVIAGCGECAQCRKGDRRFCQQRTQVRHSHAEYVAVPAQCCMPLPDDIAFDVGVLICGDTIGVGFHALSRIRPAARDSVVVVGAGPVGLGFVSVLEYLGVRSIVAELSPYRRALAQKLGASAVVDPAATDVRAFIRELTRGRGADISVDASGKDAGVNLALDAVRPEGRVILAGAGREANINPWSQVLEKEISIYGTWYFTDPDYYAMLEAYRAGLKVDDLITHRFSLEDASTAYALFARGETGKVVFVPKDERT
jgi:threonine dehydrogenase-like Zn-dependent dehydrogenase